MWVIGENLFLPDLHLGQRCIFLNKFNTEVELALFTSIFEHVVDSSNDIPRLQIPAPQAKATRVKIRDLVAAKCSQARVRKGGGPIACTAVFSSLRHSRANLTNHG